MTEPAAPDYGIYFKAWLVLLGITIVMVFLSNPAILVVGMAAKAAIIALWFMHLRYEKLDFTLLMVVSILFFSLVLYGLLVPDGLAM